MKLLMRNKDYRLQYIEPDTGFGLVYSSRHRKCLFLNPLATILWKCPFDCLSISRASQIVFGDTAIESSDDYLAKVLSDMCERGLLLSPGEDYQEKEACLGKPTEKKYALEHIYFYSTKRCNARCYHCYQPTINSGSASQSPQPDEVTKAEFLKLVEDALPLGLRHVKITGGEPFLRDDLVEIMRGLRELGVKITIETNGYLINEEIADVLFELSVGVAISLDSGTEDTHDAFRRLPGSFRKVLQALTMLSSRGCRPKVIMSMSQLNYNELEDVIEVARSHGCDFVKINPVSTLGLAQRLKNRNYLLTVEQVLALYSRRREIEKKYGVVIFLEGPPAFSSISDVVEGRIGICPFTNMLGVLSDGSVSFCGVGNVHNELIFGQIKEDDFEIVQFWHEATQLLNVRNLLLREIEGVCSLCIHEPYCKGSCRALAYEEFGSFLAPHLWCQKAYDKGLFPSQYLIANGGGDYDG